MDAPEEDLDIKLQKISGDLLADFDKSLPVLLRKPDGSLRSRVRVYETYRLTAQVLGPFQELPQLLDPRLPKWIPTLAEAYLEHLQARHHAAKPLSLRNKALSTLGTALSIILYTMCKIRGEKVIVRFFHVETRYLEPLLGALEDSERLAEADKAGMAPSGTSWVWQERYTVLLWLSHLMLAPFDLSTISSAGVEEEEIPVISGLDWPENLPGIALRILPLAIKYLASPGKERDAAKALLIRISMRKDMQQLGVLDALVRWALFTLSRKGGDAEKTPYLSIGILSYLAGILASSSDTSDMDQYLTTVFHTVHGLVSETESSVLTISSSVLARKMAIKVIRSIAVLVLRKSMDDEASTELIETTIGYLLESLADNDTPVRLAASKALSVVTLKLDADMASQVVDAVLDSLNNNVLGPKDAHNPGALAGRDLSAVNPLEWHGLMLTLSHLLYRRSPPAESLAAIVPALAMGLSFEQRSASGVSVGTNVRDAACFGIWAMARRYTTDELLAVPVDNGPAPSRTTQSSVLQVLATELILAACLDPAGNIRRGSSAALQELIGRHPDTVKEGIWLVQAVDYHAVARRSRAIQEVALATTKLDPQYGLAILQGLLGWRGVGHSDVDARRAAGTSYGIISSEMATATSDPVTKLVASLRLVLDRVNALQQREVDELHGLLLSSSAVLDSLPALASSPAYQGALPPKETMSELAQITIHGLNIILRKCKTQTYRRPELVSEAACRLIVSAFPVLQVVGKNHVTQPGIPAAPLLSGPTLVAQAGNASFLKIVAALDSAQASDDPLWTGLVDNIKDTICEWLKRQEPQVVAAASEASLVLLVFCTSKERVDLIQEWADTIRQRASTRTVAVSGHFAALTLSYCILPALDLKREESVLILSDAILSRWSHDKDIDTRACILKSLTNSHLLQQNASVFLDLIADGLDDYTTNARGDVGSHVRLEAIKAARSLWEHLDATATQDALEEAVVSKLFLRILRLAAEKLDRVRVEAQLALRLTLKAEYSKLLSVSTFSSQSYFAFLLNLLSNDWLHQAISATAKVSPDRWMDELLAGLVGSADTGNEDLVIASRAALCDFCEASPENLNAVCTSLLRNLKTRQGNDRVIAPTLEIVAFLFHTGLFAQCTDAALNYRGLCLQVQKSAYKSGNVRKIEACIRVYSAIAAMGLNEEHVKQSVAAQRLSEGILEARKRLGALMFHPWPRIRTVVVDELWGLHSGADGGTSTRDETPPGGHGAGADMRPSQQADAQILIGKDWGKAEKSAVKALVEDLGLH